jgi:hypothetical protein
LELHCSSPIYLRFASCFSPPHAQFMATTQHYIWASGHFLLLLSAFRYFFAVITFKNISLWWYKAGFTGALISYAVVCQKSLRPVQLNAAYFKRALQDENVPYFVLAYIWYSSRPVALALLPYTIFSLFHALTFTRTTLMPQFLPPGTPSSGNGNPQPHPIAKRLQVWVKANYDTAMKAAAYIELLIFARVLIGALTFQNALVTPIIYAHFLRQRYYQSPFTRDAAAWTNAWIDRRVRHAGTPRTVVQIWDRVQMVTERWVGTVLVQNQADASPRS